MRLVVSLIPELPSTSVLHLYVVQKPTESVFCCILLQYYGLLNSTSLVPSLHCQLFLHGVKTLATGNKAGVKIDSDVV